MRIIPYININVFDPTGTEEQALMEYCDNKNIDICQVDNVIEIGPISEKEFKEFKKWRKSCTK